MMTARFFAIAAAATIAVATMVIGLPGTVRAAVTDADRPQIEAFIKDYLLKHPEVLRDALTALDQQDKVAEETNRANLISSRSAQLFNSVNQAVVGNPKGGVTLVEFFDYNCAYCKKSLDDIAQLMKANPDLRVVLKDFPILSPQSVEASHVAIAIRKQFQGDRYWQYHYKLLSSRGVVGGPQALAVAKDMGADMAQLDRDMRQPEVAADLKEVADLADGLQLTGTPSFVTGNDVVVGAVGLPELSGKIQNVRKCGRTTCG